MIPPETSIEGYYHSALEACAQASQLEIEDPSAALTEYRRSIALIETMRSLVRDPTRPIDDAYFAGVEDVEGICRVHIAKLEGELLALRVPSTPTQRHMRRKSSDSLNSMTRGGLTRAGSVPSHRKDVGGGTGERTRRTGQGRGEQKTSRSPSPDKKDKEKKPMPFTLRPTGMMLARVESADSTTSNQGNASQAAVEASRAATLAWQGKKPNGRPRNSSPTSSRAGSIDINTKRPSITDTISFLDTPLIDFSAPVSTVSGSVPQEFNFQTYTPLSPAPTPPPQPPPPPSQPESPVPPPRRKPPHSSKALGRSNATLSRPAKALKPPPHHPRSASAPDLSEPVDDRQEVPPISVSISEDISPEQELSREEKALKGLKGVDEALAKTILNDIVVRGDEVQWDDIAGLEEAKTSLKWTVIYPFLRPDLFSGLREPARGMLLFGPPGTGKTMLARAVATQAKSTFFSVSASTLVSKYLGESEKLVKALFTLAKALSPSIIFVDEIDSLLSSRSGGDNENEASRRLKTEFLIQWSSLASAAAARTNEESPRVLVLAATNLPWAIDDAARRRFVLRQYIPLPEPETRRLQFETLLSKQHHTLTEDQLDELVVLTEGFSGSDITALTKDAAMGPLRSLGEALLTTKREEIRAIGFEDFVTSLRKVRPSVSKEGIYAFEKWNDEFGSKG